MTTRVRAPVREIFGWAMFDFANSSYTTVIITVVFAELFPKIVGPDLGVPGAPVEYRFGNSLWAVAQALGYVLVVISAPIFGAIMDYSASKKKFLLASYLLTIFATAALFFVKPGGYILGMALISISLFGFASGENIVSSFLPDLGPPEDLGKISGYAWGLGYMGGLISTALVTLLGPTTIDNYSNLRFVGPITGLFFLVAGIPTFMWVREHGRAGVMPPGENYISIGFRRLAETFRLIRRFRDLMIFLFAVFFSMAGLIIVIAFTFIYGDQIVKWDPLVRNIMFVITQFTAMGGALLFGFLQDRIGAKKTFNLTLILWIFAITLIWATNWITDLFNDLSGMKLHGQYVFLVIGALAGTGLGATQSASRAMVGIFSPESKAGEFFGFWGLSGKLAAIFGLVGAAFFQNLFGLHNAILLCSLFFLLALFINMAVNEERGKKSATLSQDL